MDKLIIFIVALAILTFATFPIMVAVYLWSDQTPQWLSFGIFWLWFLNTLKKMYVATCEEMGKGKGKEK